MGIWHPGIFCLLRHATVCLLGFREQIFRGFRAPLCWKWNHTENLSRTASVDSLFMYSARIAFKLLVSIFQESRKSKSQSILQQIHIRNESFYETRSICLHFLLITGTKQENLSVVEICCFFQYIKYFACAYTHTYTHIHSYPRQQ